MKPKRFPEMQDLSAVYAVLVVFIYGWSTYWFLWTFPSWINHLTLNEILVVLAYSLTVNFLESLLLLAAALALFLLAPRRWLEEGAFARFGTLLGVWMALGLFLFARLTGTQEEFSMRVAAFLPAGSILAILLSILLCRLDVVTKAILSFAERAKIFLYLTLPASLAAALVVLVRLFILS